MYRPRNATRLLAADLIYENGKPITPETYPGEPEKSDFVKLCRKVETYDEFLEARKMMTSLAESSNHVNSSQLNAFLIKGAQLGRLPHALTTVYTLHENQRFFSSANVQLIYFLNYLRVMKCQTTSYSETLTKLGVPLRMNQDLQNDPVSNLLSFAVLGRVFQNRDFQAFEKFKQVTSSYIENGSRLEVPELEEFAALGKKRIGKQRSIYGRYKYLYAYLTAVDKTISEMVKHECASAEISSLQQKIKPFLISMEVIMQNSRCANIYEELEFTAVVVRENDPKDDST